ncbi:putative F-box/LRR-repeat protein 23 [Vicia villosa]|uniref:putative F-box/LRR-repeat protein 23 n=1 Tax=Vicia villosa TaxID=3911 RepID=UPI00273C69C0|nr:putative F-box/LRR-repeat protein 23 [Vicia villosa]
MDAEGDTPNWLELPRDATFNILLRLDTIQILTSVCQVCPLWWNICKDPSLWRSIRMKKPFNSSYDLVKICQYAVQRSCDRLEDIDIEQFATDDLLKCLSEHASNLRCLRLQDCSEISDEGLIEAAKHFPLLEELRLSYIDLSKNSFESLGQSCPHLKTLNYAISFDFSSFDDNAFAIAKTMPELRHIRFLVYELTDDGVLAILHGCPLLESLRLDCYVNFISESLKKMCCEKIKNVSFPLYSSGYSKDCPSENESGYSNLDDEDKYEYDSDDDEFTIRYALSDNEYAVHYTRLHDVISKGY